MAVGARVRRLLVRRGPEASPAPPAACPTFDEVVLPHLDAAFRLARWLMGNEHDAEDAVQDASLRAFRYFGTFAGGNGRAWFLKIVRNTCWASRAAIHQVPADLFDEEQHSERSPSRDPEALLMQSDDVAQIERALGSLPDRFRDLLVLRELEGLSYRELSEVLDIPVGTVMSGLSRARRAFRTVLAGQPGGPSLADDCVPGITPPPARSEHSMDALLAPANGRGTRSRRPRGRPVTR